MRRGGIVEILPYLFDLLSEKITERMWKLSAEMLVGRGLTLDLPSKEFVCTAQTDLGLTPTPVAPRNRAWTYCCMQKQTETCLTRTT